MKRKIFFLGLATLPLALLASWSRAQLVPTVVEGAPAHAAATRPHYAINAKIDYDLLTLSCDGKITIPVKPGDSVRDAVFFIYANAGGVGGDDERRKNIVVDSVTLGDAGIPFKLDGAVLRAKLPRAQTENFTLGIKWHGVVPRAAPGSGGLADMMGGLSGDLGGLLGGATTPAEKPKNIDYGLYSYGNGILSLGSFWYPQLAVRQDGKWHDEAPEGLGDVAFSEMSDFDVVLDVPQNVKKATTAQYELLVGATHEIARISPRHLVAYNVRDFSVLISEDYEVKSKTFAVAGKQVQVSAFTTKKHADKVDKAIDIAGHALQIYAKRFGAYPYSTFVVAEGPMRGGAGGMEYSGMTAIASMLYEDWSKQLGGLAGALGMEGISDADLNKIIGDDDAQSGEKSTPQKAPKTQTEDKAENPAADLLSGLLGQQKGVLDSIFEMTIAHEVAHQWWAIGVGSDSQRAPWLDESLTNYSATIYYEDRYGKARAEQMRDLHLKTSYATARMLGSADAPVNLRTSAYGGNVQYGGIVYGKGALFYDALRELVGDELFFKSLRQYFARYDDQLATSGDLLAVFKANAPNKSQEIKALYQRWIEEKHGDDDITGGKPMELGDMLGGLLGGGMMEQ